MMNSRSFLLGTLTALKKQSEEDELKGELTRKKQTFAPQDPIVGGKQSIVVNDTVLGSFYLYTNI